MLAKANHIGVWVSNCTGISTSTYSSTTWESEIWPNRNSSDSECKTLASECAMFKLLSFMRTTTVNRQRINICGNKLMKILLHHFSRWHTQFNWYPRFIHEPLSKQSRQVRAIDEWNSSQKLENFLSTRDILIFSLFSINISKIF